MIVITGAAGFIGSCLVSKLNHEGYSNLILVDDFSNELKNKNLEGKSFIIKIDRKHFFTWVKENNPDLGFIFHIGARTDTAEFDKNILNVLNLDYSKSIWNLCSEFSIPLIYASSAATYGLGELGYNDDHSLIPLLKPLNPYGESKNDFDKWVLEQNKSPDFWAGMKFFNVYGPNEFHKNRMASVVYHSFNQIKNEGKVKLFRSHRPDYEHGKQLRDFIYVKDVIEVVYFFMKNQIKSGIFNLGTGKARTFHDLVLNTFKALEIKPCIEFVDTPEDIRDKYQYFTEAKMTKLQEAGYTIPFKSLEEGIFDYVQNFLMKESYL